MPATSSPIMVARKAIIEPLRTKISPQMGRDTHIISAYNSYESLVLLRDDRVSFILHCDRTTAILQRNDKKDSTCRPTYQTKPPGCCRGISPRLSEVNGALNPSAGPPPSFCRTHLPRARMTGASMRLFPSTTTDAKRGERTHKTSESDADRLQLAKLQ